MFDNIDELDIAVEWLLEKATSNPRSHDAAATMTQEDHDQHTDALAHHVGAIEHYRNKPVVKSMLEHLQKEIVPLREYVNTPIKLGGKVAPQITAEDLNLNHPKLQGRTDHQAIIDSVNTALQHGHNMVTKHPDMQALVGHSHRAMAHLVSMLEWHNAQRKGEGAHHKFAGKLEGPELQGNYDNSRFRGHSTPSATERDKFRTQAITKQGGAKWHPGLPELTSLEEVGGHPSSGKLKEMYPFREIKVNGEPLKPKTFGEGEPELIHDKDYATGLTRGHKVKFPGGSVDSAVGGYHGTKSIDNIISGAEKKGALKKSDPEVCTYFPDVTVARFILAKNLLPVFSPFSGMDDEAFADLVVTTLCKTTDESSQAAVLAEAYDRLEKAKKQEDKGEKWMRSRRIPEREWHKGVADVLSGKVSPLPLMEAGKRSSKEGEKRDELQDIEQHMGERKRSPFAVPKHVFTDDSYTKVDPEKYKEWVAGQPEEQDVRNEHATYGEVVRSNPEAQKRHNKFVELHRDMAREGLGRSAGVEDDHSAPSVDHQNTIKQAAQDRAAGRIDAKEYARIVKDSASRKAKATAGKVGAADMSPEERAVRDVDPTYNPRRPGVAGAKEAESEKDLTDIAHGKIPSHMLADRDMFQAQDDNQEAHATEMTSAGSEGELSPSGSKDASPSPIQLINDHPGFKAYLKMREHALGHYKDPAVRQYMAEKIGQHENAAEVDPAKLAGIYHVLHKSRERAIKAAGGLDKLHADLKSAGMPVPGEEPETAEEPGKGTASVPETMMTPEQRERFTQVKQEKAAAAPHQPPVTPSEPLQDPKRTEGLRTADPEYKKKLMADIQAREAAKKPR